MEKMFYWDRDTASKARKTVNVIAIIARKLIRGNRLMAPVACLVTKITDDDESEVMSGYKWSQKLANTLLSTPSLKWQ